MVVYYKVMNYLISINSFSLHYALTIKTKFVV
jgi:hypothetical protein